MICWDFARCFLPFLIFLLKRNLSFGWYTKIGVRVKHVGGVGWGWGDNLESVTWNADLLTGISVRIVVLGCWTWDSLSKRGGIKPFNKKSEKIKAVARGIRGLCECFHSHDNRSQWFSEVRENIFMKLEFNSGRRKRQLFLCCTRRVLAQRSKPKEAT